MGALSSREWVPIEGPEELQALLQKLDQKGRGHLVLEDVMNVPRAWSFIHSLPVLFYFDELTGGPLTFKTFVDMFEFFNRGKEELKEELTDKEFSELMKRGVSLTEQKVVTPFGSCSSFRHLTNLTDVRSVYVTSNDDEDSTKSTSSRDGLVHRRSQVCVYGESMAHTDQADTNGSAEVEEATEDVVYSDYATTTAVGERVRLKMFKELTVFLSEDGAREEFMQWMWRTVDSGKQNFVTLSELSVLLRILEYDNIYLNELAFSNKPGVSPEQRVMNEFDTSGSGVLSKDDFIILADLITREYEYWESRHLESVGNYELGRIVGKGASGIVRIASNVDTHERYALKIVKKGNCAYMSRLDHEIESLKILRNHPHVVQLEEVLEDNKNIYLRMELLGGGSLTDLVRLYPTQTLPENVTRYYMRQLFETLAYCHSMGICHRDVRLENMLLDNNAKLKLSDFGQSGVFAAHWDLFATTLVGSIYNLSPEQVLGVCYSGQKIDVWSAGIAMFCLLVGCPPFFEADSTELLSSIVNCTYELPVTISVEATNMLRKMINAEPNERPSFDELLSHPWFHGEMSPPVLDSVEIPVHDFYMRRPDLAEMIIAQALYQYKTHFHLGEIDRDILPDSAEGMWCIKCHYPSLDLKFLLTLCTREQNTDDPKAKATTEGDGQEGFTFARGVGGTENMDTGTHLDNQALKRTLSQYPYKRIVSSIPQSLGPTRTASMGSIPGSNSNPDFSHSRRRLPKREAFLFITFEEGEKGTFAKLCRKLKVTCDEALWEAAEKQKKRLLERNSNFKSSSTPPHLQATSTA